MHLKLCGVLIHFSIMKVQVLIKAQQEALIVGIFWNKEVTKASAEIRTWVAELTNFPTDSI